MSEATLLKSFDLLATAPGGLARLRDLILTLAVQGKLSSQDPSEEPVGELLNKIRLEKDCLIAKGLIKRDKSLSDIAEEEKPFQLPKGWAWVRVGQIATQVTDGTHHTPQYLPSGVAFISVKDINGETVSFDDCKFISEAEHRQINARCNPERGDLLLCRIGTLGRPTLVDTDRPFSLFVSVGLIKLPKSVNVSDYFHLVMKSPLLAAQYQEIKAGGSHTNKLNLGDIPQLLLPFPSLAEQSRIVVRVKELMKLCDALEEKGRLADEQHTRLTFTLFDALANSESAHALAENWKLVAEHFDLLLDRPEAVEALEQAILQLAVRGLLVPQDPRDEPASELLKKIRAEKDVLIAAKTLKREKAEPLLADDALPFDLPASWSWAALGEVTDIVRGITFPATQKTREPAPGRIACLRTANVQKVIEWDDMLFVDRSFMGREDQLIKQNDIVMSMANSRELVGKVALIDEIPHAEATFGGFLGVLRPRRIDPRYAMAVLRTPYARSLLIDSSSQTTNIANVSLAKLRPLPFPLPPEAEQSRIVARVESLRRLCADLRQRLVDRQSRQSSLAGALVESIDA